MRAVALLGGASALMLAAPARADLSLEQAIQSALTRNERAHIASEELNAANARLARARAFFFPELSATGTYTRRSQQTVRNIAGQSVVIQQRNALNAVASVRWSILDARGFPLYRQARAEREATKLDSANVRRLLAFEAADAFFSTLSAEQVRLAAERRLEFARANLKDAQARFEAQLVSSNDVTRAKLELASAELEAARAKGDVQNAYVNLGYLIADEVKPPLVVPQALLDTAMQQATNLEAELADAQRRRLDVGALKLQAEAARHSAQEPLARLFPSLALTGQYRLTNEAGLAGRVGDGYVGAELSWTLFDGGERYADRDERLALWRIAQRTADAQVRQVNVDVREANVLLETAQSALRQAQVASDAAQQNAHETGELYRQGLTGALELADAGLQRFEAEVALARERYGLALSLLGVRSATGLDPLGQEVKQ
jgi:outer membrane protein TolC